MKLLLLGGTGEARMLAGQLQAAGHCVTYSLAGLTDPPDLPCDIISGGFSAAGQNGVEGLVAALRQRDIELLLDATHPYAERISAHALAAAGRCHLPCWQLYRPGWPGEVKGAHSAFETLSDLIPRLAQARLPLFTIGQSVLSHAAERPVHQHWIVRTAIDMAAPAGITVLCKRGPFTESGERDLMQSLHVDALVTKDSGGTSVVAKLRVAHQLGIPVYIQQRPPVAPADRVFTHPAELLAALASFTF